MNFPNHLTILLLSSNHQNLAMHRQSLIKNMAKEIETCEGTPIIEASDRETFESKVQSEEFLKFCESVIDFKYYTIVDMKTVVSAHNNKFAWKLFMEN